MKIIFLVTLFLAFAKHLFADPIKNVSLTASYAEGFGVVIKREVIIKNINLSPDSKGGFFALYILVDEKEKNNVILVESSDEIISDIRLLLDKNPSLKISVIGYESLSVSGVPRLSKLLEHEESDDLITPSGRQWNVEKIFVVKSFKLLP
jgi:hypothetical protein